MCILKRWQILATDLNIASIHYLLSIVCAENYYISFYFKRSLFVLYKQYFSFCRIYKELSLTPIRIIDDSSLTFSFSLTTAQPILVVPKSSPIIFFIGISGYFGQIYKKMRNNLLLLIKKYIFA